MLSEQTHKHTRAKNTSEALGDGCGNPIASFIEVRYCNQFAGQRWLYVNAARDSAQSKDDVENMGAVLGNTSLREDTAYYAY